MVYLPSFWSPAWSPQEQLCFSTEMQQNWLTDCCSSPVRWGGVWTCCCHSSYTEPTFGPSRYGKTENINNRKTGQCCKLFNYWGSPENAECTLRLTQDAWWKVMERLRDKLKRVSMQGRLLMRGSELVLLCFLQFVLSFFERLLSQM